MTHDIKVGQYARYNDNLYTVNYYGEDDCILLSIDKQREFSVNPNRIKTASTPQELILVGDLVETEIYGIMQVEYIDGLTLYWGDYKINDYKITKILTPNTNEGYDLQWESEKEC